ncbi:MAG TPA: DUF5700 domain-containing putative Zn-dependent protease, partial [Blastocatellia bacterium]|nr:DUF5700 domain-containing putative Zn-dependent protease [Blastocatellia bacterium]
MTIGKTLLTLSLASGFVFHTAPCNQELSAQSLRASRVDVRVVTDEPDAVLAILARKKANQPITEADWRRLFSSEGYIRLKKREAAMKRSFEDSEFQAFIVSDKLIERAQALQDTLDRWKRADPGEAARRALAYLPEDARIKAKIYPMIKPRENSFVFEVKTDPAIFLYINPEVTMEQFENTLAHELHHIGYSGSCPSKQTEQEISKLPEKTQNVIKWIGAFGEGFAMLAAAGGPDVHPHAASKPEDRARWDRDVANFNDDLKKVERFFNDVLAAKLSKEEEQNVAFSFFGVQGAWYTVGWKMAVTIEKVYGRARLIECMCDQRKLLPAFNQAATHNDGPAVAMSLS